MADNDSSAFKRFLLPEKEVSLKLVFDNFRNYAIIGALGAMAHWFQSGKANTPSAFFRAPPMGGWEPYAWLCLGIAAVLFILNLLQSYHIGKRLFAPINSKVEPSTYGLPWHVGLTNIALAFSFVSIVMATAIVAVHLAIYIVWFSVVGSVK
jgi:heme exporter protein D